MLTQVLIAKLTSSQRNWVLWVPDSWNPNHKGIRKGSGMDSPEENKAGQMGIQ